MRGFPQGRKAYRSTKVLFKLLQKFGPRQGLPSPRGGAAGGKAMLRDIILDYIDRKKRGCDEVIANFREKYKPGNLLR